jgi:serine O-acetyltransferase
MTKPNSYLMRLVQAARSDYSSFLHFVALIREEYGLFYRAWTLPGYRAVVVQRFGVWTYGVQIVPLRILLKIIYKIAAAYIRNFYAIELPRTTRIGRRFVIGHQGGVVIHPDSSFGDDCAVLQNVTIGAVTGDTFDRCPVIGNRVEIGAGAVIIGGIVIGDDVRVGPNAVVTMNVPAGSMVVAPPPRIIQFKKPQPFVAATAGQNATVAK